MTTKQISIAVKMFDEATAPLRKLASTIGGFGTTGADAMGKLSKMVDGVSRGFGVLKAAAVAAGGAIVAGRMAASFNDAARKLEEIGDASKRTGLAVEALSELRYIAELTNYDFGALTTAVTTAEKNLSQFARTGGGRAAEALQRLGVRVQDGSGRVREINDLLPELVGALGDVRNHAEKVELTKRIFGDDKFLLMVAEGRERLTLFRQEAQKLGNVFTEDQVESAMRFRDSLDRVSAAWLGVRAKVVGSVGPELAEMLNKVAVFVAALPKIASNAVTAISDAFRNEGDARERLLEWGQSFTNVVKEAFIGAGAVALVVVQTAAQRVFEYLDYAIDTWLGRLPEKLITQFSLGVNKIAAAGGLLARINQGGVSSSLWDPLIRWTSGNAAELEKNLAEIRGETARAMQSYKLPPLGAFIDNSLLVETLTAIKDRVAQAGEGFVEATDKVLAFRAAIADVDITEFVNRLNKAMDDDKEDAATTWDEFKKGWGEGWQALEDQASRVAEFSKGLVVQVGQAFSAGFSNAIIDAISGVKSLGEAMREFGANTLRMIAQVTTQFLVLRAITGIAGAFATSAGGAGLGQAQPGVPLDPGAYFSTGGFVGSSSMPGGDRVHAVLDPREYVVSSAGTQVNDAGTLAYMNRGGRVVPAGTGGPSIIIAPGAVVINISGGGSGANAAGIDRATLERAVVAGVTKALANNPSFRQTVRNA